MSRFKVGQKYDYTMLYGGGRIFSTVSKVTETTVTMKESWIAEDILEEASSETTFDKLVDSSEGCEYIVLWTYREQEGVLYAGKEE